jgi:hypothetical protein
MALLDHLVVIGALFLVVVVEINVVGLVEFGQN